MGAVGWVSGATGAEAFSIAAAWSVSEFRVSQTARHKVLQDLGAVVRRKVDSIWGYDVWSRSFVQNPDCVGFWRSGTLQLGV